MMPPRHRLHTVQVFAGIHGVPVLVGPDSYFTDRLCSIQAISCSVQQGSHRSCTACTPESELGHESTRDADSVGCDHRSSPWEGWATRSAFDEHPGLGATGVCCRGETRQGFAAARPEAILMWGRHLGWQESTSVPFFFRRYMASSVRWRRMWHSLVSKVLPVRQGGEVFLFVRRKGQE